MIIQDFLNKELDILAKKFQNVQIKYGFDIIADAHIVEITPQSEYYNNPALDTAWMEVAYKVLTTYPDEMISFVTNDSELSITNPKFVFNSESNNVKVTFDNFFEKVEFENYEFSFVEQFQQYIPKAPGVHWAVVNISYNMLDNEISVPSIESISCVNEEIGTLGEYSYAMAA